MTLDRQMVVLGKEPNAVDLLSFLDGVDFDSAWSRRVVGDLGDATVFFTSREDYICTKKATGRPKGI